MVHYSYYSQKIGLCLYLLRLRPKYREIGYNNSEVQNFTDGFLKQIFSVVTETR